MEQEPIARTALDEMVQTDRNQLMKAMVPYLPPEGQRFISVYAKAQEFMNTMAVFSGNRPRPEMTAAALPNVEPVEMLNDLRRFCSDKNRRQIDQITSLLATIQLLKMVNEENGEEEPHECRLERESKA